MLSKQSVRWAVVVTFLLLLLAAPRPALAWSAIGSGYQDGSECYDFPGGRMCFVTQSGADAPAPYRAPTAGTYVVRWGDTLRIIADRLGIPLSRLIAANPQIWNPNLIYVGQVIYLPSYIAQPTYHQQGPSWGHPADHPWGSKPGRPEHRQTAAANLYTIQRGDTLKAVARKYDTTVEALLDLNPALLGKANRIHVGLVIRLW